MQLPGAAAEAGVPRPGGRQELAQGTAEHPAEAA